MSRFNQKVKQITQYYLDTFPDDKANLGMLFNQLEADNVLNDRKTLPGHITACGVVLSPDKSRVLLVKHKMLNMWLQPGGHVDHEDPDPLAAAKREVEEETGLILSEQLVTGKTQLDPIVISSHVIPARADNSEPEHYHHDFKYVFIASSEELSPQLAEVHTAEWVPLDDERTAQVGRAISRLRHLNLL